MRWWCTSVHTYIVQVPEWSFTHLNNFKSMLCFWNLDRGYNGQNVQAVLSVMCHWTNLFRGRFRVRDTMVYSQITLSLRPRTTVVIQTVKVWAATLEQNGSHVDREFPDVTSLVRPSTHRRHFKLFLLNAPLDHNQPICHSNGSIKVLNDNVKCPWLLHDKFTIARQVSDYDKHIYIYIYIYILYTNLSLLRNGIFYWH